MNPIISRTRHLSRSSTSGRLVLIAMSHPTGARHPCKGGGSTNSIDTAPSRTHSLAVKMPTELVAKRKHQIATGRAIQARYHDCRARVSTGLYQGPTDSLNTQSLVGTQRDYHLFERSLNGSIIGDPTDRLATRGWTVKRGDPSFLPYFTYLA
jgi:hypothetical protein